MKRPATRCRECWRKDEAANQIAHFWERVQQGPGCWEWSGHRNRRGYGKLGIQYAHRMSWEVHNGPIPKGMEVCHRCDNPPCVNPAHLFLGDTRDNALDMVAKGRARGARMPGEAHPRAVLTNAIVLDIMHRRTLGQQVPQIAAELGQKPGTVMGVVYGRRWRHLTTNPSGVQPRATSAEIS